MDSSDTTRKDQRAASSLPYLVLLRMGFTKPTNHLAAGALLPHRFILTGEPAVCFGTFLKVTLTGRYPASCPVELGLSSSACAAAIIFHTHIK